MESEESGGGGGHVHWAGEAITQCGRGEGPGQVPPRQTARTGCWGSSCCEEERMGSTARAKVEKRTTGPSSQPGAGPPCLAEGPIPPLE